MRKGIILYFLGIAAFIWLFGKYFAQNISFLLSGKAQQFIIRGQWVWVLLYVIVFGLFIGLFFFSPKKGLWRKNPKIYLAFIIALFAEMFGFPLTVYFLSSFVELPVLYEQPAVAFTVDFLGASFELLLTSLIAGIVSVFAAILIVLGWKKIYKSEKLVKTGIYCFVRHPQYLGIMVIATIWLLAWPTLLLAVMWPILVFSYYKLARREEKELQGKFGKEFEEYKRNTPMILPFT